MRVHSKHFIDQWKGLLANLYDYEFYMDFMVVPSLLGRKHLSYLPLLNYTDRKADEVDDLLELGGENDYSIRILNGEQETFEENETVTMRLDLEGMEEDQVFTEKLHGKCRNQIRKAIKSPLRIKTGNAVELIDDFYDVFSLTMQRYGTPVFDKKLFTLLPEYLDDVRYIIAYVDNEIAAALVCIMDEKISWVPWAGSDPKYSQYCPNHLIYWEAIRSASQCGCSLFDFGRSGYGGSTFRFKRQWGAEPVKIETITSVPADDLYAKYAVASRIWKKLPKLLSGWLGPKLCRYLSDL